MNITFPTRPGAHKPGTPRRADPCRCLRGPVILEHGETCLGCGHYEEATIDATWSARAQSFFHGRRDRAQLREAA